MIGQLKSHKMRTFFFSVVSFLMCVVNASKEAFHEEVYMKALPTGDVMATFSFTTLSPAPLLNHSIHHFDLLPRFVGELIQENGVQELDVALSRGVWRSKLWGYPPRPTATGARVGAFFKNDVSNVDRSWKKLVNVLAGQFCASLNFMDSSQTVSPKWSFQPKGSVETSYRSTNFRYATLPGENVCTENLTPWKKLLPCESKRGLATLLNSHSIHRTRYHSLGFTIRLVCDDQQGACTNPLIELNQNVVLVFDPVSLFNNPHYPVKKNDWSVKNLFGIGVTSACPLATSSRVFLDINDDANESEILPVDVGEKILSMGGREIFAYDVKTLVSRGVSNIQVMHKKEPIKGIVKPPCLEVTRFLIGHGHQKGGIVTKIFNNDPTNALNVVYLDVLPWFLRVYLHSLAITDSSSGKIVDPLKLNFVPGVDRERPYSIELVLKVPPKSHLKISLDFEYSLLKWLEYPPDANKGFYVGSALVSSLIPGSSSNLTNVFRQTSTYFDTFNFPKSEAALLELVQLYTESLLVNLPTPDFSMPYNVICLTCTVVALAFGPLHNITTKSLELMEGDENSKKSFVKNVRDKISQFFSRKPSSSSESPVSESTSKAKED